MKVKIINLYQFDTAVKNRFSRRRGSEEKSGQGIKKRVPLIDERKIEVQ